MACISGSDILVEQICIFRQILMMLAIGIICFTNKNWLQMPRYMLGTVISEIAGVYFFSVLGFGMQVLCRETKPEAKEFFEESVWNLVSDSWNYDYTGVSLHTYLLDHAHGELKVSCLYAQPENYDYNLIEAWKTSGKKLLPSKMTKKQKETYERYKMLFCGRRWGVFMQMNWK